MLILRDSITLGILAGLFGNIFKEAIIWTGYLLGFSRYNYVQFAAAYFVTPEIAERQAPAVFILGSVIDWTTAALLGVLIVYVLRYTGPRYAIIKGMWMMSAVFLVLCGTLRAAGWHPLDINTPLPNLVFAVGHVLMGAAAGWFAARYGRAFER